MKLKFLIISALALLAANTSKAAGPGLFDLGVKIGVSTERVNLYNAGKNPSYGLVTDNKPSFQAGGLLRINFLTFHLQPEILFTAHRYEMGADLGTMFSSSKVKYNTLDVPLLFGMKFLIVRVQAGPVFNLMTNTSTSVKHGSYSHYITGTRPTVSWAAGIGIDLFKLNFDFRYNGRFARGSQTIQIGDHQPMEYNTRTQGWTFSLAYVF